VPTYSVVFLHFTQCSATAQCILIPVFHSLSAISTPVKVRCFSSITVVHVASSFVMRSLPPRCMPSRLLACSLSAGAQSAFLTVPIRPLPSHPSRALADSTDSIAALQQLWWIGGPGLCSSALPPTTLPSLSVSPLSPLSRSPSLSVFVSHSRPQSLSTPAALV
jgi:hypothetical protein